MILNAALANGWTGRGFKVTPEVLRKRRLVPNLRLYEGVKILGTGKIGTALVVRAHAFSAGARAKIEKAGGRVEVLPRA